MMQKLRMFSIPVGSSDFLDCKSMNFRPDNWA
jgi:hypothetical protein